MSLALTEVANEVCAHSVWCPFSVDNVPIGADIEAKVLIALSKVSEQSSMVHVHTHPGELVEATFCFVDLVHPLMRLSISSLQGVLERIQPWVELEDAYVT